MLHLSRQRINRLLKVFEKEGMIALQYGKIQILDAKRLYDETRLVRNH